MKVKEVTTYLEDIAPLRFQEKYDNAGLIYGDPNMDVNGALISLDCTPDIIDEAISLGVNMVISHHPIVFKGIKQFRPNYYVDQTIIKAIKNDIAIYAIHTNLDNVLRCGVNEKIASKIGLENIDILRPSPLDRMETEYTLGAGVIGDLHTPMDEQVLLDHLKHSLHLQVIKHTALLGAQAKKIAICGGSGSFLLSDAIRQGADVYISADFKYHEYFDANGQILIADIGHYESEYSTIELLFELLTQKFPKFAAHSTKVVTNPVNYC